MPWRELEHTADWAIHVTADDFPHLLAEAGRGMYALLRLELDADAAVSREFAIDGVDRETQLVAFLDELLFLLGSEREAYDRFEIALDGERVTASVEGCRVLEQTKEIKAVTFHRLAVVDTDDGVEATVVFDV